MTVFVLFFRSVWVPWNPQTLQNKGKRKMTNRPWFAPPPPTPPPFAPPSVKKVPNKQRILEIVSPPVRDWWTAAQFWYTSVFGTLRSEKLSNESFPKFSEFLRSEKLQNESFPNFWNFRPGFFPEFCSEFPPKFSRTFRASFHGRRRPEKFTKNPRHFSMQNSQANTKKKFTKFFWRAGKVRISSWVSRRILLRIFRGPRGLFVLCFLGNGGNWKFTKLPAIFQCQIPRRFLGRTLQGGVLGTFWRPPSQNPSENPSPGPFPEPSQNPS